VGGFSEIKKSLRKFPSFQRGVADNATALADGVFKN